jgi:hypothetical protein
MIGIKSSQKQLATRLGKPEWEVLIDEALNTLPYEELNLLRIRFSDKKYPSVLAKLQSLCLMRNPIKPQTVAGLSPVEKESIRLDQLAAELDAKAKDLLSYVDASIDESIDYSKKTRQVGHRVLDLTKSDISLEYMDRVEIILACVGMRNQTIAFEPDSAEYLLNLCELILNKASFPWFDRIHEAELAMLLIDFSLDDDFPHDPLLVNTSVAVYEAVTQDIVTHSFYSQPIEPYLQLVNTLSVTKHSESVIRGIAGIFDMQDEELIKFFQWNLKQLKE